MATISYRIRKSKSEFSTIYLNLRVPGGKVVELSTTLSVMPDQWSGSKQLAKNTLADLEAQALTSQTELSEQIAQIKAIFTPEVSEDVEGGEEATPNDNIVKASQIEALELKLDEIILLQKEVTAKMLEQARKVEVQQAQAKKAPAKSKKPVANPLKFP